MAGAPYPSGWRKGVYPTQAFLDASIAHGELSLSELDGVRLLCVVLGGNVPAERLYTGQGFARRGTVRMFYDDTGWTDYGLYEYLL